ncbi:hypothetical protein LC613_36685 [Nostoc sphaeroides CHAB 2801]|uniref:hypothetical protein n=1 Tax=Nostoc sphaeroides TaxID=446679 RepID=UPI001E33CF04|nr:hypothetical protein [Nostoc sphaeroides]MCC5633063.1 hypothetical protein [Nostoc sphaeroides CHAB 2801]
MLKNIIKSLVCFSLIISLSFVSFAFPALADPKQEFVDGAANSAGNFVGNTVVTATVCVVEGIIQEIVLPGTIPACIAGVPWFAKKWVEFFAAK